MYIHIDSVQKIASRVLDANKIMAFSDLRFADACMASRITSTLRAFEEALLAYFTLSLTAMEMLLYLSTHRFSSLNMRCANKRDLHHTKRISMQ
jgi:hypothetical protein